MNEALGTVGGYSEDFLFGGGQGAARKREMDVKHRMVSARMKVAPWRPLL